MGSILQSIKKLLGISPEDTAFDNDVMIHINTAFAILNQLNIGPPDGFYISGPTEEWSNYVTKLNLTMVETFVYLKVKLIFDPPASTAVIESMNRTLSELEFRLYIEGDPKPIPVVPSEGGDISE